MTEDILFAVDGAIAILGGEGQGFDGGNDDTAAQDAGGDEFVELGWIDHAFRCIGPGTR